MSRRELRIVALLAVALAALGFSSMLPRAFGPAAAPTTAPSTAPVASDRAPSPTSSAAVTGAVYREGVIGRPSSITPLTARDQADRDLVALVFRGLVRLGPDGTLLPDLAESWQVDPGRKWYEFTIRSDATWQDGVPVTSADVVYTIAATRDPGYNGPLAGSWSEVTATAVDRRTVRLALATPLGGFLQAATLPLLPEHLLRNVPISALADSAYSRQPVGDGPYRLVSVDGEHAVLEAVPAALDGTMRPEPTASPSLAPAPPASSTPSGAGPASAVASTAPPSAPAPASTPLPGSPPPRIEIRFFDDATALAAALRGGQLDAAGGLPPTLAPGLGGTPGLQVVRYPQAMFSGLVLNVRPNHPEFSDQRVRVALLKAIDRERIVADVLAGTGTQANTPIPPSSWAFDRKANAPVPFDRKGAVAGLKAAGWTRTKSGWLPPKAKKPLTIEIVTPDESSKPIAYATAQMVAADWRSIGLGVTVVALPPAELVGDRLMKAAFAAAVLDVNVGLDPDLYPLFASTQAVSGGSNLAGVQGPSLDKLLVAARAPNSPARRIEAYAALQGYLARAELVLPLYFRDYLFVASDRLRGVTVRELADSSDRYWDVLDWRLAGAG